MTRDTSPTNQGAVTFPSATDAPDTDNDTLSLDQFREYNELVATLYGCLHSNHGFDAFFEAFREHFRCLQGGILGLTKAPIRMIYGWTFGYPEGFEQWFINSDLPEQDAALQRFSHQPPRQFGSLLECDPEADIFDLLTDATRQWVEAVGLGDSAGMLVADKGDTRIVFLANRLRAEGCYTEVEVMQMNMLAPHIENAINLYLKLYHASADNESLVSALDHVSKPMIVFNEMAQVVKCNSAADALLAEHPELFVSEQDEAPRLKSRMRRFSRELDDAILTSIINSRKGIPDSITLISQYDNERIAVCITPLTDQQSKAHGALAELYTRRGDQPIDRNKLRALFECTEAESLVAEQLMAGKTAAEIAEHQQLSLHTIRQYIKNLLAKNGFRRQSELVGALIRALA